MRTRAASGTSFAACICRGAPRTRYLPAVSTCGARDKADAQLGTVVSAKLDVIVNQIRALQDEARTILDEARAAQELHRAECRFKKIPGRVYHLYRREGGRRYFSMLSPDEWAGEPPHAFEGSFRLEPDMTWTPAASLGDREERDARAREVLALLAGRGPDKA